MQPTPIKTIAHLLGLSHNSSLFVTGASIDSRKIEAGEMFFALPGARVDGHHFLAEVAKKKASLAIVKNDYAGPDFGMLLIHVPDVLEALQNCAKKMAAEARYKIIAITGSIGKTTTKEFTRGLLEGNYKVYSAPLSYNSQRTLPLTILQARGDEEILLLEMGMSEPGQIAKLVSIAPPDISLITTVSLQHATAFPEGLSAIAKEKAAIFSHPKTKLGLYYKEMPYVDIALRVGSCEKRPFVEWGRHFSMHAHQHNLVAALSIARALDIAPELLKERIPLLQPPSRRFERVEKGGITFINDAYNANPEAMIAAFEALPQVKGKKIGVISEMNDLGIFAKEAHTMVGAAAVQHLDHLLCIGAHCEVMRPLWKEKPFELFSDKGMLADRLKELAQPNDLVLLKGARAYALDEFLSEGALCF